MKPVLSPFEFQRVLRWTIGLPLLFAVLVGGVLFWQVHTLRTSTQKVDRSDRVIAKIIQAEKLLLDAVTGVRGYYISRDQVYLEPYLMASRELPVHLEELGTLLSSDPEQFARFQYIKSASTLWLSFAKKAVTSLRRGRDPLKNQSQEQGKVLLDGVKRNLSELLQEETRIREKRSASAQRTAGMVMTIGLAVALILGALLTFFGRWALNSLSSRYDAALAEMEKSREWFSTTLKSIGDAVLVCDQRQRIVFLNPMAETLTGWKLRDAKYLPVNSVLSLIDEKGEIVRELPREVLDSGAALDGGRLVLRSRDGSEHPIEQTAAPIRDAKGSLIGVILIFRDVREKREKEKELQESESRFRTVADDLRKALEHRDTFLSIASHELKTPLTSLKLQLQLTDRAIKPETGAVPTAEKLKGAINMSIQQVQRLDNLISDLLDVSRIHRGKFSYQFEGVDLAQLVKEHVNRLCEQTKTVNCTIKISTDIRLWIEGDKFRLEQVVSNLFSNALKYGAGKPFSIELCEENGFAVLRACDQGMGIPKDKISTIFDKYERAVSAKNISGMGLGLYIVRQIVHAHKGTIDLQSDPGRGTTFTVKFPLREEHLVLPPQDPTTVRPVIN
jgi:PAS domain S-box-containing protein